MRAEWQRNIWKNNRALCASGVLFAAGIVLCLIGWVLFPEHDPFSIDSHDQYQKSAPFTAAGLGCFLFGAMLFTYDIDRRIRHRRR